MHAFFVIDVNDVADLRARIPSFPTLPLVGCIDCAAWLLRRDFRIDHAARCVELFGVFAAAKALASFGNARKTLPRGVSRSRSSRSRMRRCPQCHDEMVFSGYQYHFACDRCAMLSVFGQNT